MLIHDIEIMRAGTHTSSSGDRVTFTREDLAEIAGAYDPSYHESPAVIGHPSENGPAYGWVKSLKAAGGRLLATLDLVPEFVEAVRQGLFRKRSASIYNDLDGKGRYLRHVGFLGAMPPAVKALSDINLADGKESATFEFSDKEQTMSWKEKVKGLFTQAVDEIPEAGVGTPVIIQQPAQPQAPPAASFSEEQVAEREKAAARQAREQAKVEFAEEMRKTHEAEAAKTHGATVKARIDAVLQTGKVIPAQIRSGLMEFASALPWKEADLVEFAEAGKKTPYDWFMSFIESLPPQIHFGEVAGRDKDVTGGAAAQLSALIKKKMEANPQLSYSTAFSEVQAENPAIAAEYVSEMRPE